MAKETLRDILQYCVGAFRIMLALSSHARAAFTGLSLRQESWL